MKPQLTLLAITDGRRDCLIRTLQSFEESVDQTTVAHRLIVNDSLDQDYGQWIDYTYNFDEHISHRTYDRSKWGFAGAIKMGWQYVPEDIPYVFHLEDDFTFNRFLDVHAMIAVLEQRPYLRQMALRRQAWNDLEQEAGGIVECHPHEYADMTDGPNQWLEHRLFFTTNPSIYPQYPMHVGWPSGSGSEAAFTQLLLQDPAARFGYWGSRDLEPWVTHIGQRSGTGY